MGDVAVLVDALKKCAEVWEEGERADRLQAAKDSVIEAARRDENRGPELQAALAALWVLEQEPAQAEEGGR